MHFNNFLTKLQGEQMNAHSSECVKCRSLTETVANHKGVKIHRMYILNFLNILTSVQVMWSSNFQH